MSTTCRFLISGPHESIQDLRIALAQHDEVNPSVQMYEMQKNLMNFRNTADLSFKSLLPLDDGVFLDRIMQEQPEKTIEEMDGMLLSAKAKLWGIAKDVVGDADFYGTDVSRNKALNGAGNLYSVYEFRFECDGPEPRAWMDALHEKFNDLNIQVGIFDSDMHVMKELWYQPGSHELFADDNEYEDDENSSYDFDDGDDDSDEDEDAKEGEGLDADSSDKTLSFTELLNEIFAREKKRLHAPAELHPDLSRLFKALAQDDAGAVEAQWPDANARPGGSPEGWSLLHYATHFEAVNVAKDLLARGADLQASTRYGVTPMDVLMDARNDPHNGDVCDMGKRVEMLKIFLAQDPEITGRPLMQGVLPSGVMARFGMGQMLAIAMQDPHLNPRIKNEHCRAFTYCSWSESVGAMLSKMEKWDHPQAFTWLMQTLDEVAERKSYPKGGSLRESFKQIDLVTVLATLSAGEIAEVLDHENCSKELAEHAVVIQNAHTALSIVDEILMNNNKPKP